MKSKYIFVGIIAFFFLACSTKKNTAITRTYHNVTSRYNIYFNGYESYKKGEKKIEKELKDDYSKLIPVFPYNAEASSVAAGDMDRTIKKSTKVSALHSITVKPEIKKGMVQEKDKAFYNKKEYNKWMDDCYFLIGKSHFSKGDFDLAIKTFRFVLNEYKDETAINETQLWLARSLVSNDEALEAIEGLKKINIEEYPRKLHGLYYAVYASAFISIKKYDDAIVMLDRALKLSRQKKTKIRYTFLLAQLYEITKQEDKAYEYYTKVIKMNPPYEKAFNAIINRASVISGEQDDREIRQQFLKMINDAKNKEYLDQIYFAIGNIDLKQNKKDDAIINYKKSAQVSISNDKQKTKSFITLADLYYPQVLYHDLALSEFFLPLGHSVETVFSSHI